MVSKETMENSGWWATTTHSCARKAASGGILAVVRPPETLGFKDGHVFGKKLSRSSR